MQTNSEIPVKKGVNGEENENPTLPPPYSESAIVLAPTRLTVQPVQDTVVIHQGPAMVPMIVPAVVGQQMGFEPTPYICKACNHHVVTRVERTPNTRTHLFALCLCLLGCWLCTCFPYCMNACNNADHYCPSCGTYAGSYKS